MATTWPSRFSPAPVAAPAKNKRHMPPRHSKGPACAGRAISILGYLRPASQQGFRVARERAYKRREFTAETTAKVSQGEEQKVPHLTLRDGVWYSGALPQKNYREAFKATLRAADIELPPKPKRSQRPFIKKHLRLELRPWWHAFIEARKARETARAFGVCE